MTKRSPVRDFLAAPETVLRDKRERQKAIDRRAQEEAKTNRLRASKLKRPPSLEDMLADIIRVAEDEATNPWHEFRCISRRRYELYGHYPVSYLDAEFGTFSHALEVAGLRDQVGTRLWRANRAAASREAHSARYYKRYVQPYVVGAKESRELHKPYLLLSISDTHAHYLCPFVWSAFLGAIEDLKPDGVLLNGDILDGGEISRFPQVRGRTLRLKDELEFQRSMFRHLRRVHDGDLFSVCGNHDLADRLPRYMSQIDPVISQLDDRRVDELMGLGEFGVKLFHGGSTKSPKGTEDAKPGFLLFGTYRIHHGTLLGAFPALGELRAAGRNGQSGHVHRASLAYGTTERDEGLSWMSTPMGCRHEAGQNYVASPNTGWQRGFGVCWMFPDGGVQQYPVVVHGKRDRVIVEGHVYERDRKLFDPSPDGNWLEDPPRRARRT